MPKKGVSRYSLLFFQVKFWCQVGKWAYGCRFMMSSWKALEIKVTFQFIKWSHLFISKQFLFFHAAYLPRNKSLYIYMGQQSKKNQIRFCRETCSNFLALYLCFIILNTWLGFWGFFLHLLTHQFTFCWRIWFATSNALDISQTDLSVAEVHENWWNQWVGHG